MRFINGINVKANCPSPGNDREDRRAAGRLWNIVRGRTRHHGSVKTTKINNGQSTSN